MVTKRRRLVKKELVKAAGGKCIRCGYSKCIDALQFHHRNPSEKDGELSNWKKSLAKGLEEIKKCDLLCANCHAEVHMEWRQEATQCTHCKRTYPDITTVTPLVLTIEGPDEPEPFCFLCKDCDKEYREGKFEPGIYHPDYPGVV